jgi:hypothetical protein
VSRCQDCQDVGRASRNTPIHFATRCKQWARAHARHQCIVPNNSLHIKYMTLTPMGPTGDMTHYFSGSYRPWSCSLTSSGTCSFMSETHIMRIIGTTVPLIPCMDRCSGAGLPTANPEGSEVYNDAPKPLYSLSQTVLVHGFGRDVGPYTGTFRQPVSHTDRMCDDSGLWSVTYLLTTRFLRPPFMLSISQC